MKRLLGFIFACMIFTVASAQFPTIEWQKCYGGSKSDLMRTIIHTSDGNLLIAGETNSKDYDVTYNHDTLGQFADIWLVHVDTLGNLLWQKSLGGSKAESIGSIINTFDGGFLLAANSKSRDGDLIMNHDTTGATNDAWIIKLNSSGAILWQKNFGGSKEDFVFDLIQTPDSSVIVVGSTASYDGDVSFNHDTVFGTNDVWVFKIGANGNMLWEKSLGGSGPNGELANEIIQTFDLNYMIAGVSGSSDGDSHFFHDDFTPTPKTDSWMILINTDGDTLWERCYGGTGAEDLTSVIQLKDSSFVVTQRMWGSTNGDVVGNTFDPYNGNVWTLNFKPGLDSIIWQKVSGGPWADRPEHLFQKENGNVVVLSYSQMNGFDVSGNHGGWDFWLFELDSAQNYVWRKSIGGSTDEILPNAVYINDDSFYVCGSASSNNGNISGNHGSYDFWLSKINLLYSPSSVQNTTSSSIAIYPNPSNGSFYIRNVQFDESDELKISIFDVAGKLIFEKSNASNELVIPVDLNGIASGFYLITLQTKNSFSSGKIIIE